MMNNLLYVLNVLGDGWDPDSAVYRYDHLNPTNPWSVEREELFPTGVKCIGTRVDFVKQPTF